MNSPKTCLLFTGSYPYEAAAEHTFLDPEMNSLCTHFDQVIIIPALLEGKRRPVPDKVVVEESYAQEWSRFYRPVKAIVNALTSSLFWQEIGNRPQTLLQFRPLKRALWISTNARFTADWVIDFIVERELDIRNCVFYTYWLDHITLGIGLAKQHMPDIRLISRAHHYDLYEYFYQPPYIPFRTRCLEQMDRLYLISDDGKEFMLHQHPMRDDFYRVSRLGVRDPGFTCLPSSDDTFRIVSCSFMVPFKRIDLLFEGVLELARSHPKQKIEWRHIGDGPVMPLIQEMIEQVPSNLECILAGYLPNNEVMTYYQNNPVDIFINVSQSEGIPVSIMEAQSCAIPVIATGVGGTPEIVNDDNGCLLPKNPSTSEISGALEQFMLDRTAASEKRRKSAETWQEKFNSDKNSDEFARSMGSLTA